MPTPAVLHHVDHGGGGETLVLLHAFPLDSTMYDRFVPWLHGWRVVTIDLPGLGMSAVPVAEPSMAEVATCIVDVLDSLGLERAVVMGISTGGYAALQISKQAPERLLGLVLGSTSTRLIAPDVPAERRQAAGEIEQSGTTDTVAGSADEGLGDTAHAEQPELVGQLRATIAAASPDGVAWMARAIAGRTDTTEALAVYDGPVLLVFGAEDTATPPQRGREMLAAQPRARLEVLLRTGHLTALEQPAHVAELLEGFRSDALRVEDRRG